VQKSLRYGPRIKYGVTVAQDGLDVASLSRMVLMLDEKQRCYTIQDTDLEG